MQSQPEGITTLNAHSTRYKRNQKANNKGARVGYFPSHTLQVRGTVGEQIAFKLQSSKFARSGKHCPLPRFRVSKAQRVRVQQAPVRESERVLGAVEVVAQDWMTYCIHVKSLPRRTKRGENENGTPVIFLPTWDVLEVRPEASPAR